MASSPDRRAIVLVVDGWGANYVGPYGNTWLETPGLNQLASQGVLYEHALADSISLDAFYAATWSGTHAALPAPAASLALAELMSNHQRTSRLLSDDRYVIEHPLSQSFTDAERVALPPAESSASTIDQTQIAKLMAAAVAAIERHPADLIWIHSRGMMAPWDAPFDLRDQFRDIDDPESPRQVVPPAGPVSADIDPDVVQAWVWAYAAQVSVLDYCVEALLEAWRQLETPALLVVMGARGYALAEHGRWGNDAQQLHSEHLHVPLFLTTNTIDFSSVRCQPLVQPCHVFQTLLEWFGIDDNIQRAPHDLLQLPAYDLRADTSGWPSLAVARQGSRWALRTSAWHACIDNTPVAETVPPTTLETIPPSCQMYLKPDDRWEVNNVADRCPHVVEEFLRLCDRMASAREITDLCELLPLHADLLSRPD